MRIVFIRQSFLCYFDAYCFHSSIFFVLMVDFYANPKGFTIPQFGAASRALSVQVPVFLQEHQSFLRRSVQLIHELNSQARSILI